VLLVVMAGKVNREDWFLEPKRALGVIVLYANLSHGH